METAHTIIAVRQGFTSKRDLTCTCCLLHCIDCASKMRPGQECHWYLQQQSLQMMGLRFVCMTSVMKVCNMESSDVIDYRLCMYVSTAANALVNHMPACDNASGPTTFCNSCKFQHRMSMHNSKQKNATNDPREGRKTCASAQPTCCCMCCCCCNCS